MAAPWYNIECYFLYLSHNHASTNVSYTTYHTKNVDAEQSKQKNELECSAAQRAPGVPRLTQAYQIGPEWYISWITSRKHAWMPLHQTPRTRDDALVSCTLRSEARPGGAKFTGLHQHQRYRHTVALKHQRLMRTCQSEHSSWPSPALLCRQAAPIQLTGQCPWQQSTGAEQAWESQPNQQSILLDPNLVLASKPAHWFLSAATTPL